MKNNMVVLGGREMAAGQKTWKIKAQEDAIIKTGGKRGKNTETPENHILF